MSRPNPPQRSTALIFFSFSAFFSFMVIRSLLNGSFGWSQRRTGKSIIISPDTHPFFYWGWLGFWTLIVLWIGSLGWKELRALRKLRDSRSRRR